MRFILHTLLSLFILFVIMFMLFISWQFFPDNPESNFWFFTSLFIFLITHILYLVYYYCSSKMFSLYALPLSHIIFPIGLMIFAGIIESYYGAGGFALVFAFIFSLHFILIAITTFIISLLVSIRRKRTNRNAENATPYDYPTK